VGVLVDQSLWACKEWDFKKYRALLELFGKVFVSLLIDAKLMVRWEAKSNGELESLGYKQGFRVDVDIPQSTWEEAPHFHDVLVLNTGHW
jgi:hypothetical protein